MLQQRLSTIEMWNSCSLSIIHRPICCLGVMIKSSSSATKATELVESLSMRGRVIGSSVNVSVSGLKDSIAEVVLGLSR